MLSGRERETAIFTARVARTREGHPQHTALLGDWAIGKTTLLMHWRWLRQQAGDAVVLTMAYPQPKDEFLGGLAQAVEAGVDTDWRDRLDLEIGLDIGIADARLRRSRQHVEADLRRSLRRLVPDKKDHRTAIVLIDDIDLVAEPGDALLQLRASALELYAADVSFSFVVAASPGLFGTVHGAHEPLVRFFEPITLGALDAAASTRAITEPLAATDVRFDAAVLAEIVELSGGRPYYLQKLAYCAFDASEHGQVGQVQFAVAFEQAFASVSQEIFAARWSAMAVIERRVVSVVASSAESRSSGDIESAAARHGIRPDATRQALRRLVARGHVERHAYGQRGRYVVHDRLFRRYLERQG
jgi:hypothetical protein